MGTEKLNTVVQLWEVRATTNSGKRKKRYVFYHENSGKFYKNLGGFIVGRKNLNEATHYKTVKSALNYLSARKDWVLDSVHWKKR